MIDYAPTLIEEYALNSINLIHYTVADSNTKYPCITYRENNNTDYLIGDTMIYSELSFVIEVWDKQISVIQQYTLTIDEIMKGLGFKRNSMTEQWIDDLGRKILIYDSIGIERTSD